MVITETFPNGGSADGGGWDLPWQEMNSPREWISNGANGLLFDKGANATGACRAQVDLGAPDMYAQLTKILGSNRSYLYGAVRLPATGTSFTDIDCYVCTRFDSNLWLYRYNAGAPTTLVSYSQVQDLPETLKIEVSGDNPVVLRGYIEGAEVLYYEDSSASRITGNQYAGMLGWYSSGGKPQADDFEAGTLGAPPAVALRSHEYYYRHLQGSV